MGRILCHRLKVPVDTMLDQIRTGSSELLRATIAVEEELPASTTDGDLLTRTIRRCAAAQIINELLRMCETMQALYEPKNCIPLLEKLTAVGELSCQTEHGVPEGRQCPDTCQYQAAL